MPSLMERLERDLYRGNALVLAEASLAQIDFGGYKLGACDLGGSLQNASTRTGNGRPVESR